MKPILVCGPSGSGKSTYIQKLAGEIGGPVYGFVTRKEDDGHIYLYAAGDKERQMGETNRIGDLISTEKRLARPHPEVFDGLGLALLSDIPSGALVLMDELGILESDALAFQARVLEVLQGPYRVLAALKDRDTPFLNAVRELGEIVNVQCTMKEKTALQFSII
ncbi:MAG: nucleoside-triphosphatase [Clostridiales bacterium]|nr:nucleoside-triphosphatase [Clostridiales bacterium]